MSSRGTFAGVAPSGRIVMSGATTGWEMLEQAPANWPIVESTWEGGPWTSIDRKTLQVVRVLAPGHRRILLRAVLEPRRA